MLISEFQGEDLNLLHQIDEIQEAEGGRFNFIQVDSLLAR